MAGDVVKSSLVLMSKFVFRLIGKSRNPQQNIAPTVSKNIKNKIL